jgi:hypothetical protein
MAKIENEVDNDQVVNQLTSLAIKLKLIQPAKNLIGKKVRGIRIDKSGNLIIHFTEPKKK